MTVIDDYLNKLNNSEKAEFERIRAIVHRTVGDAEQVISYGMPAFKYKGKYLIGINSFKDHLSLFPTSEPIDVLRVELKNFKLSRGTIQFTLDKPIPENLIKKIIKVRVQAINKLK